MSGWSPRHQRLALVGVGAAAAAFALVLASIGLRESAAFFQTPSQILADPPQPGQALSVGGLVALGSVRTEAGALVFRLVDDAAGMDIRYAGPVPNLFREGQCVIAQGAYAGPGPFEARRVLAKHDESYQPREIAQAPQLANSCGDVSAEAAMGVSADAAGFVTANDAASPSDGGYAP